MPQLQDFNDQTKNNQFFRTEWFTPVEGENRIRILSTQYAVFPSHYIPSLRKSFTCFGKENGCPYDTKVMVPVRDEENKPTFQVDGKTPITIEKIVHRPGLKYLLWIIDRKDNKLKIGKFTYGVVKTIVDFKSNEDYKYEDIPPYDVVVKRTKTGPLSTDVEYSVIPTRANTELTEAEQKLVSSLDDLEQIVNKSKEKAQKLATGQNKPSEETGEVTETSEVME